MPTVSSLFMYPIKSCRGIAVRELIFDRRGPVFDRRWMVVDEKGRFISQRSHPRLALIQPVLADGQLRVLLDGFDPLTVPEQAASRREVSVWSFTGHAEDLGDQAAEWFTRVLRARTRLVRFAADLVRPTSQSHTTLESELAFADGYPALLTSVESLGDLNRRLERPVPMNRFRPNIVVRDCQPFEEDTWKHLRGPELDLAVVKPCDRCKITTIDQRTLVTSKEPLRTLSRFRRTEEGVMFGQNCIHLSPGTLRVGDDLRSKLV
jgi:hypothetical protein